MHTTYQSKELRSVAQNLYLTGEGVYYARLRYKGKSHKASLKTSDRKTADRKLKDFVAKIEREEKLKPDGCFKDIAEKWQQTLFRLKPMSRVRRQASLRKLMPTFGQRMLRDITKVEIEQWISRRLRDVKPATVNLDLNTIEMVMEYAKDTLHIIDANPLETIKKLKTHKPVVIPPTKEQFRALIEQLENNGSKQSANFVKFLAFTGVRLDEARGVLWQHIDFAKGTMLVVGGQYGTKNYKQRYLPLFAPLRALLEKLAEQEYLPTDRLFTLTTAKTALQTASKNIGMPEGEYFNHHDMRHFFCSNRIEEGIDFATIAVWLGHSDGGKLVAGTYGHLRASHSAEMAKKVTDPLA